MFLQLVDAIAKLGPGNFRLVAVLVENPTLAFRKNVHGHAMTLVCFLHVAQVEAANVCPPRAAARGVLTLGSRLLAHASVVARQIGWKAAQCVRLPSAPRVVWG